MISIIDYGLGNVLAFQNVYKRLDIPVTVARTPAELRGASKLILPGVGSFDHAIGVFEASGMRGPVEEMVLRGRVPILGICVGMQMLGHSSEEGSRAGLGWVPGHVRKFEAESLPQPTPLPHMGWNDVEPPRPTPLFRELEQDARFYFLHSYYFAATAATSVIAITRYGGSFASAVNVDHVFGVQFHPEKSHHCGAQLLKNFADL